MADDQALQRFARRGLLPLPASTAVDILLDAIVDIEHAPAERARPPEPTGLLICNPPYGRRLSARRAYATLGRLLTGPFASWRAAILCPDPAFASALRRQVNARRALRNGGLPVELLLFEALSSDT